SNFYEFRIHDLAEEPYPEHNYVAFTLDELPRKLHLLDFLVDPKADRRRREKTVSVNAGYLIGQLYDLLREQYIDPDSSEAQHSLNVLCVRIVFCLFAEDAGVFERGAFYNYLNGLPARQVRVALRELFLYLDTAPADRDPYASDHLKAFPYVNGGLFADHDVDIPQFTDEIVDLLLHEVSAGTDWSTISPTIFGGVFESTLNPETRHAGGMHYTSPENIHRVIDPAFLDDLTQELEAIINEPGVGAIKRRNNLRRYQDKLASLTFFDPACGSGNFLTETYLSVRRLENKVISELSHGQTSVAFDDLDISPIKVSLDQFYGLEINDFAVSVAGTALWIAELQANLETEMIVTRTIESLPLSEGSRIIQGNALQTDWSTVLPPENCDYIIGNPPFLGARNQSATQKAEVKEVFAAIGATRNLGDIDYVAAWYAKAATYMGNHNIRAVFVSTNSICQGAQVANIWHPLYEHGIRIDFAHDTFRWANESTDPAAVYCVIVGFSKLGGKKTLFHYPDIDGEPEISHPERINAYLKDAPQVFVWNRSKPLSSVPELTIGSQPIDNGNYLFKPEEKDDFLALEPAAEKFVHRWYGSQEFIKGIERWVLWLGEATPAELRSMPEVMKRVQAVRDYRLQSNRAQTKKAAERPQHFGTEIIPEGNSLLIPEVSSERRRYIPIGFVESDALCSNLVRLVPNASKYHFGVLHSRIHNAWMRTVAGRLKSDFRYSAGIVYNNFIWPEVTKDQECEIAEHAQTVLEAREAYEDATIAQMYDPDHEWLYPELTAAHQTLDAAVERAYGLTSGIDEKEIVERLFQLYAKAMNRLDS
ncbi:MAG TPA: DNA methyltransferase, partial [Enteractinococcus sp.]